MGISDGNPVEIYVDDDAVIFKPYNRIGSIDSEVNRIINFVKSESVDGNISMRKAAELIEAAEWIRTQLSVGENRTDSLPTI